MGKWGYVDKGGKIVINPQFDDAGQFSDGLAWVKMDGHFGYTDNTGKLAINPQFDRAQSFSEGLAARAVRRQMGFCGQNRHLQDQSAVRRRGEFFH